MANTSGLLSEGSIGAMAAGLLDEYTITSLDDNSPLGRYLAREFGTVRREVLEEYPWRIARNLATLTELVTPPPFGFTSAYQTPADCIRVFRVTQGDQFNAPPMQFKIYGSKLYCNTKTKINIIYVRDENNVALWTALMGRTLAAKLAMYASQNVTGKAGYFDKCRAAYQDGNVAARMADALAEGSEETVYDNGWDGFDTMNSRGLYQ